MNTSIIAMLLVCAQCASTLELVDDEKYIKEAEEANSNSFGNPILVLDAAEKYSDARKYDISENLLADLIKKYGATHSLMFSSLSVVQGKQSKYAEALVTIDKALTMDPSNTHTKMVKASWLYETGKADEADKLIASVPVPKVGDLDYTMYWSCVACYNASTGIESEIEKAMKNVMAVGDRDAERFFRRDVVFDKYRTSKWFIDIVGNTVKK
jgi:predicted Zn-dependent protease